MGRVLPRFDFRVDLAGETHAGLVRSVNEDAHLVAPEIGLFAVADGMGGLTAGDVASPASRAKNRWARSSPFSASASAWYGCIR